MAQQTQALAHVVLGVATFPQETVQGFDPKWRQCWFTQLAKNAAYLMLILNLPGEQVGVRLAALPELVGAEGSLLTTWREALQTAGIPPLQPRP